MADYGRHDGTPLGILRYHATTKRSNAAGAIEDAEKAEAEARQSRENAEEYAADAERLEAAIRMLEAGTLQNVDIRNLNATLASTQQRA